MATSFVASTQAIDPEFGKLLGEAHACVRKTLIAKRELLTALAHTLLEKGTLDRAMLDGVFNEHGTRVIRRVGSADY